MSKVKDIMTTPVVTVTPTTPLAEAVEILTIKKFRGLPVVDENNHLVGMLTERSLVLTENYVHMRTLIKLFSEFKYYKNDNSEIRDDLKKIMSLKVTDMMSSHVVTINERDTMESAGLIFGDMNASPLPVVNDEGTLVGILSLSDLTKFYGVRLRNRFKEEELDQQVDNFLANFEHRFLVVSKFRANTWFIVSIFFAVMGFIIAMMMIIRVSV